MQTTTSYCEIPHANNNGGGYKWPKLTELHTKLFNKDFSLQKDSSIFFAGQITGVEGYTESASMGLFVAAQIMRRFENKDILNFPFPLFK